MNGLARLPEVLEWTGLSKSTIYEMIKAEEFPRQISLGGRAVGWLRDEVEDWVNKRVETSRKHIEPGREERR